jgi:anaerobic selenocysteine-containing dehydrogenase
MAEERTAYRTCPLCEATCGLELTLVDDRITRVRGDADDVFSQGYLCPKGAAFGQLEHDPDRVRQPLVRDADGELRPASWAEAFRRVAERLEPILAEHGRDAVAVYLGNPNVHNLSGGLYARPFVKALATRNIASASTVDQMPKHVSSGLLFGDPLAIPVPDIDRTDLLVMLGANPRMSNGSLMTAPDLPGRLDALRSRGGRLIVVDPRRSRTAADADEHHAIRPGTDALLLLAVAWTLFDEELVALGDLAASTSGLGDVRAAITRFSPEAVAGPTGIAAGTTRRLARQLAAADRAVVYGRIGTTTVRYGTVASWAVDLVNLLTGNLDRAGGAMFPRPAHVPDRSHRRPFRTGRWRSRVRGLPEVLGEIPVATLADEIATPGDGQVRALFTVAGNPVLSTPNGERLDHAIAALDLLVCIDPYLNETTRHADVLLPPPGAMHRGHYDLAFTGLAIRNVANYSPPAVPLPDGQPDEWEILLVLAGIAAGQGPDVDVDAFDDLVARTVLDQQVASAGSRLHGLDPEELWTELEGRRGPERILDLLLRAGPYGDGFGRHPDGLSLAVLEAQPHGVDLGPLEPRIPEVLATASGTIELAPPTVLDDLDRVAAALEAPTDGLVLIGRRHLRTNNSWMHNLPMLTRGRDLCTLQVHPEDADRHGLVDGDTARIRSRVGAVTAPVEVTDDIAPGVVSLPHGFGHDLAGVAQQVARRQPGVNSNLLTDERDLDPLSGTAVLNGIPVEVEAVRPVPA